jgi:hypothetical protein
MLLHGKDTKMGNAQLRDSTVYFLTTIVLLKRKSKKTARVPDACRPEHGDGGVDSKPWPGLKYPHPSDKDKKYYPFQFSGATQLTDHPYHAGLLSSNDKNQVQGP